MEENLKTFLLEYEKSTFLIDLVRHDSGKLYIKIQQTIDRGDKNSLQQEIKINPSILDDLIEILAGYQKEISSERFPGEGFKRMNDKNEIQNRYLKGVPINELSLQFNCSIELIEQILRNKGLPIVVNNPPLKRRWRRRR